MIHGSHLNVANSNKYNNNVTFWSKLLFWLNFNENFQNQFNNHGSKALGFNNSRSTEIINTLYNQMSKLKKKRLLPQNHAIFLINSEHYASSLDKTNGSLDEFYRTPS